MAGEPKAWMIDWYETAAGAVPARKFLAGLSGRPLEEALALLEMARRLGNRLGEPRSAPLFGGLFELRGDQVRLAYIFRPGRRILILDGLVKKKDKIPPAFLRRGPGDAGGDPGAGSSKEAGPVGI